MAICFSFPLPPSPPPSPPTFLSCWLNDALLFCTSTSLSPLPCRMSVPISCPSSSPLPVSIEPRIEIDARRAFFSPTRLCPPSPSPGPSSAVRGRAEALPPVAQAERGRKLRSPPPSPPFSLPPSSAACWWNWIRTCVPQATGSARRRPAFSFCATGYEKFPFLQRCSTRGRAWRAGAAGPRLTTAAAAATTTTTRSACPHCCPHLHAEGHGADEAQQAALVAEGVQDDGRHLGIACGAAVRGQARGARQAQAQGRVGCAGRRRRG